MAIKALDDSQRHIGILHRGSESDDVMMLELAWHHKLRNSPPSNEYLWVDPPIPNVRARQVAAFCRKVWRQNEKRIPYAFSLPNDCFDTTTGRFIGGGNMRGLTCATFVLAVFQATGLAMVEPDSWPRRSNDAEWQQKIIELLESTDADPAHIELVREESDNVRFRPEEVAGAAAQSPWPVAFPVAHTTAEQILKRLNAPENEQTT